MGGNIHVRDTVDASDVPVEEGFEKRGISVGGGCCGLGGGAHVGCHGCSLNICGLGGNINIRDAIDKDELVVAEDTEARGINVSGGCCGIGGGAHAGCHGCGLHLCGLGGNIHVRDTVDASDVPVEEDFETRGISIGGGCHGCSKNICGFGGNPNFRDAVDDSVTAKNKDEHKM